MIDESKNHLVKQIVTKQVESHSRNKYAENKESTSTSATTQQEQEKRLMK